MPDDIQIVVSTEANNGTFQHAIMLAKACVRLGRDVAVVSIRPNGLATERVEDHYCGIVYRQLSLRLLSPAPLNIIVGWWSELTSLAATSIARSGARLIIAPTIYWEKEEFPPLPHKVEALWYVSWDQAVHDAGHWNRANRIDLVRCAVDTEKFRPSTRMPDGSPWIMGRHSRDTDEKFSTHMAELVQAIGNDHDIQYRMLGATRTLRGLSDDRVVAYGEGAIPPEDFLKECDIWVFSHAPYWRETACIAMLEAMASGLAVVVDNVGGMREYVQHGRTGFLCNDFEEFVRYASLLLKMPALRRQIGSQARDFVELSHSVPTLAKQLRSIT